MFERARRYGEAVRLLDEFLGESVRERVMERFAAIAAPMQKRRLHEPWEVIARAALDVGVPREAVQALQLLYLMRTGQWENLPSWARKPDDKIWQYLQEWRVLAEFERNRSRFGLQ